MTARALGVAEALVDGVARAGRRARRRRRWSPRWACCRPVAPAWRSRASSTCRSTGSPASTSPPPTSTATRTASQAIGRTGVTSFVATIPTAAPEAYGPALAVARDAIAADLPGAQVVGVHLEGPVPVARAAGGPSPGLAAATRPGAVRWLARCRAGRGHDAGPRARRRARAHRAPLRRGASWCPSGTPTPGPRSPTSGSTPAPRWSPTSGTPSARSRRASRPSAVPAWPATTSSSASSATSSTWPPTRCASRSPPPATASCSSPMPSAWPAPTEVAGRRRRRRPQPASPALVDGAVRLPDGTLAGSACSMDQAIRNVVGLGVPLEQAIAAATSTPARALRSHGAGPRPARRPAAGPTSRCSTTGSQVQPGAGRRPRGLTSTGAQIGRASGGRLAVGAGPDDRGDLAVDRPRRSRCRPGRRWGAGASRRPGCSRRRSRSSCAPAGSTPVALGRARCAVSPWWNATEPRRHLDEAAARRPRARDRPAGPGRRRRRCSRTGGGRSGGTRARSPWRRWRASSRRTGSRRSRWSARRSASRAGPGGRRSSRPPGSLNRAWSCHRRTPSTCSSRAAASADARVERQRPHLGMVLPEVHALLERLLVPGLLGQRPAVAGLAIGHRVGDERAVAVELVVGEQAGARPRSRPPSNARTCSSVTTGADVCDIAMTAAPPPRRSRRRGA